MATVRRIRASDGPLLRQIRLAALTDSPFAFGSTLERELGFSENDWSERARAGAAGIDRTTLIAESDAEAVGIAGGYVSEADAGLVELVSMWVAPGWRRQGLGETLVRGVGDWARSLRAPRLALWVTEGNDAAIELYRRCGFAMTGAAQAISADRDGRELRMVMGIES